jgi:hypothetical protein
MSEYFNNRKKFIKNGYAFNEGYSLIISSAFVKVVIDNKLMEDHT